MKRKYIILFIIFISIITIYFIYKKLYIFDKEPIYVAIAGPMSGANCSTGKSMLDGSMLYYEAINKNGGVNKQKIELQAFDDQNDPIKAQDIAMEIFQQGKHLLVTGHDHSSCSISAGKVYKKLSIPAITPLSTNINVTKDNQWYFRSIFNDQMQAKFLAYYANKILNGEDFCIISDDSPYGTGLAKIFIEEVTKIGCNIKYLKKIPVNISSKTQYIDNIIKELGNILNKSDFIFLPILDHSSSVYLVKSLKDKEITNQIIAPDSFATILFINSFNSFEKEIATPGYYTNKIFVSCPYIFNIIDYDGYRFRKSFIAKFDYEPDWVSVYSYDTAQIIHKLIKLDYKNLSNKKNIFEKRNFIRDKLESINNSSDAIKGITGLTYFNEEGDAVKPVLIGVYHNRNIISSMIQLNPIQNKNEIVFNDKSSDNKNIIQMDNDVFWKTNVVYTGIELKEIKHIDLKSKICNLDFYIWFCFQGDIDCKDIIFLNAVRPIKLENPIIHEKKDNYCYQKYNICDDFLLDSFRDKYLFDKHIIGISFRHRILTRNNLIYADSSKGYYENLSNLQISSQKNENKLLTPIKGWTIKREFSYQSTLRRTTLGNPNHINIQEGLVKYSRFNFKAEIIKENFTMRGIFSFQKSAYIFIISSCFIVICAIIKKASRIIWFFQTISAFLILISLEIIIVEKLYNKLSNYYLSQIYVLFDILWWIIIALLLNIFINRFLFKRIGIRSNIKIPNIIPRFTGFIIYMLAFMGIIAFVFEQEISKLLATGGMFAMIIGLAVKMNIADIISGIAINIESPFRIGDWIKISDSEGVVTDITWRSTKIKTDGHCIISIPNSKATESLIHNYNYPSDMNWLHLTVYTSHDAHPDKISKILMDAVLSSKGVLTEPKPQINFKGVYDTEAQFCISFCIKNYSNKNIRIGTVWENIWLNMRYANFPITAENYDKYLKPVTLKNIVDDIDIFSMFSNEEKNELLLHISTNQFKKGDVIISIKDKNDSFYIIKEGVVSVMAYLENSQVIEVDRMGVGKYFGERALIGYSRSADIVSTSDSIILIIKRPDIIHLVKDKSDFFDLLKNEHNLRKLNREMKMKSYEDEKEEEQFNISGFFSIILNKIRGVFDF